MRIKYLIINVICGALLLYSCANEVAPTGGPEDMEPPKILSAAPPSGTTNFKAQSIAIGFDEYVVLNDPNNQIIISPPLEEFPKVSTKGKGIIVDFGDEKLRDKTTYVINFGEAIKDLNRGNALKNYTYVFSTGAQLDSGSISGSIIDAFTYEPVDGATVLLHKNNNDTSIIKDKPYYFAKTDKSGQYNIDFIAPGTYSLYAIKDENFNYLYDLPNEKVSYNNEVIEVVDGISESYTLRLFEEDRTTPQLIGYDIDKGRILLIYNQPVSNFSIDLLEPNENYPNRKFEWSPTRDTLKLWYDYNLKESQKLVVTANETLIDTLLFREDLPDGDQCIR